MASTAFRALILCTIVLPLLTPAEALEVSLEENRAERGSVGYVDMQKIFKLFPETKKARANFAELVRKADTEVNKRKTEILALRAELSRLAAERDLLLRTPIAVSTAASSSQPLPPPAVAPSTAPVATPSVSIATAPAKPPAMTQATVPSTAAASVAVSSPTMAPPPVAPLVGVSSATTKELIALLPGFSKSTTDLPQIPAVLPEESKAGGLIINLPGATTGPLTLSPPEEHPKPQTPTVLSSATVPAQPLTISTSASATTTMTSTTTIPAQPPVVQAVLSKTRLQELEDSITAKQKELEQKEADFKEFQDQEEKNLIDLESRRTEILLGKIYQVVQDVARENGVSVVVDKTQILFGHKTVDLTAKVLKKLEGAPL